MRQDESWSKSERRKRTKSCDDPKGFTMKQFCKNQKTRSEKGERTNEDLLRLLIRESLLTEGLPSAAPVADDSLKKMNEWIGPSVKIDPTATVAGSTIGSRTAPLDAVTIQGDSSIANSGIFDGSHVIDSEIESSLIFGRSTVKSSKMKAAYVRESTLTGMTVKGGGDNAAADIIKSTLENSWISGKGHIEDSTLRGAARVTNPNINSSVVVGSEIRDESYLFDAHILGGSVERSRITSSTVAYVEIVDSYIDGQSVRITCTQGGGAYIGLAQVIEGAQITGSPQIIGLEAGGKKQLASIKGMAQISGSPKISGTVSGQASVSGNAEVHGLAVIKGNCRVSGTARMISGTFTSGEYTEGTHEGGDPPSMLDQAISKVSSAIRI